MFQIIIFLILFLFVVYLSCKLHLIPYARNGDILGYGEFASTEFARIRKSLSMLIFEQNNIAFRTLDFLKLSGLMPEKYYCRSREHIMFRYVNNCDEHVINHTTALYIYPAQWRSCAGILGENKI